MARHNEVTLYGQIIKAPRILYNTSDEHDPERKIVRVMGPIAVLRGIRDFGAVDKRIRLDLPIVLSQNKKIMKQMKNWEEGDMIEIRGTLATVNIKKNLVCPHCNHVNQIDGTLAFINPIFIKTEAKGLSSEEGNKLMRTNAEISNRITVIGKVCTAPELFITDKNQRIVNYQLDIQRKYRIKEDDENNKHDFPFVKSYGAIADNDYLAIKKGSYVFVDGAIQTRDYIRNMECQNCHETFEFRETATEIVPYSTEYLMDCLSMEEIEERKKQMILDEAAEAKAKVFNS